MIPTKAIVLQRRFHVCHAGLLFNKLCKKEKGIALGLEVFLRAFDI